MSLSTPTPNIHHTAGCVILDSLDPAEAHMLLIYRIWPVAPQGAYILPKGHVEAGRDDGGRGPARDRRGDGVY